MIETAVKRLRKFVLAAPIGAFLLLLLLRATTFPPYIDEAWYILPAWNMVTHGSFGTPVIEPSSSSNPLKKISHYGIREHTYWVMPVFPLSQAGWIRMFGFGMLKVRLLTILSGFVFLAAWYAIVFRLSEGNRQLAALAVSLIAIDTTFLFIATLARPDMLAAATGYGGVAAYLLLRENSLSLAILAASACIALAGLVHPNAAMVCLVVLCTVVLMTDREKLKLGMLLPAMLPYGVAAAGWGWYVAQDPIAFRHQFFSNAVYRRTSLLHPLASLHHEAMRYAEAYGFGSASVYPWLRMLSLLAYLALILLGAFTFKRRGPACQRMIAMTCTAILVLGVIDNTGFRQYLIYSVPVLIAAAATVYEDFRQRIPSYMAGIVACLLLLSPINVLRLAIRDHEEDLYGKTIEFIKTNAGPKQLVMGSSGACFSAWGPTA